MGVNMVLSRSFGEFLLPKSRGDPRKSCDPQHLSRAAVWQMCVGNNRAYRSARACPVGTGGPFLELRVRIPVRGIQADQTQIPVGFGDGK